jgi:hypothetical protein
VPSGRRDVSYLDMDPIRFKRSFPEIALIENARERKEVWGRALVASGQLWWFFAGMMMLAPMPAWLTFGTELGPLALPILISAAGFVFLAPFVVVRRRITRAIRIQLVQRGIPMCIPCGYDLTGNTSGICPECGSRIPESPPELPSRKRKPMDPKRFAFLVPSIARIPDRRARMRAWETAVMASWFYELHAVFVVLIAVLLALLAILRMLSVDCLWYYAAVFLLLWLILLLLLRSRISRHLETRIARYGLDRAPLDPEESSNAAEAPSESSEPQNRTLS